MDAVFVVSFVGCDRLGLLKQLAQKTHELGGKWLISKVSYLEGQVAAVIKVQAPVTALAQAKSLFSDEASLKVIFSEPAKSDPDGVVIGLRVDAKDRPGLVNEISQLLDRESVKITDMECHRMGIAELGGSVFTANLKLALPDDANGDDIAAEIEALGADMVVTLD